mgnify:CR=1 FL=1
MPQLGETVAEGKITKWFKAAGDAAKPGDTLFELATDKPSMEGQTPTSGTLTATDVDVGDSATWSVVGSADTFYGAFSVDPGTGQWIYTLDNEAAQGLKAGETVQEIFTVRVTDAAAGTSEPSPPPATRSPHSSIS